MICINWYKLILHVALFTFVHLESVKRNERIGRQRPDNIVDMNDYSRYMVHCLLVHLGSCS